MNLAEQARVTHDQLQINRVIQAIISVAVRKGRKGRKILDNPEAAARRAICILATGDDMWLTDDTELVAAIELVWRLL